MFACGNCNTTVTHRQPANKIVTEKRLRSYEKLIRRGPNRGMNEEVQGWEIVNEINACPECYVALTGMEPQLAAPPVVKAKPEEDSRNGWGYNKNKKPWQNRDNRPQQRTDGRNEQQRDNRGGGRPFDNRNNNGPRPQGIHNPRGPAVQSARPAPGNNQNNKERVDNRPNPPPRSRPPMDNRAPRKAPIVEVVKALPVVR